MTTKKTLIYEIKVKGHLGDNWDHCFDNLTLTQDEEDNTILVGPVVDQAALHGLLVKVRDLGLTLLSVCCIEP